jgi:hypothetical protein
VRATPRMMGCSSEIRFLGNLTFRSMQTSQEYATPAIDLIDADSAGLEFKTQPTSTSSIETSRCEGPTLRLEGRSAFVRGLRKGVEDAVAHSDESSLLDAEPGHDLVGRAEATAADFARGGTGSPRSAEQQQRRRSCKCAPPARYPRRCCAGPA